MELFFVFTECIYVGKKRLSAVLWNLAYYHNLHFAQSANALNMTTGDFRRPWPANKSFSSEDKTQIFAELTASGCSLSSPVAGQAFLSWRRKAQLPLDALNGGRKKFASLNLQGTDIFSTNAQRVHLESSRLSRRNLITVSCRNNCSMLDNAFRKGDCYFELFLVACGISTGCNIEAVCDTRQRIVPRLVEKCEHVLDLIWADS